VANLRGDSANSTTWASRLNGNFFITLNGSAPTVYLAAKPEDALRGGATTLNDPNRDWFIGLSAEFLDRQANEMENG